MITNKINVFLELLHNSLRRYNILKSKSSTVVFNLFSTTIEFGYPMLSTTPFFQKIFI